ncbi:acyltransferase family protein [Kitasatospora sp. NPDC101176]|uniref:acyltransferase family protein n=1 Tax=Kitasatospora sp. NPDC101176 TaxID=3364099 RepID=UPI0038109174
MSPTTVAPREQPGDPRCTRAGVPGVVPPESASAGRPRLYALDGMRLMAALGVLCWHWLGSRSLPGVWHGDTAGLMPLGHLIGAYSWTGVQLFFLISGFVICLSCWGRPLGDFVTSRVVRLFPAYWFAVLATSAVLWILPAVWCGHTPRPTPSRILTNLTMANTPLGVDDIDPVYWSLWAELRFYVLFGVLLCWGLTYRRVVAFLGVWAFLGTIAPSADLPLLGLLVQPDYCWYFIAGVAFFLMHRFGPNLLLWSLVGYGYLMAQDRMRGIIGGYEYDTHHHLSWYLTMAYVTASYVLVAAVALGRLDRVRWKWLTAAGALTYPLYLLHQEIGFEIITRLRPHLAPYPTFFLVLAVMLVLAHLVHRFVERPLAPRMRRMLDASFREIRRSAQPPAPGRPGGGRP